MADKKNVVVNETVEEVKEVATTPNGNTVEVIEKDSFIKKTGRFIKKHGKKILVVVGIAAAGAAGYVLGDHHSSSSESGSCDTDGTDEVIYGSDAVEITDENSNN
jgi:hypothetical protein